MPSLWGEMRFLVILSRNGSGLMAILMKINNKKYLAQELMTHS